MRRTITPQPEQRLLARPPKHPHVIEIETEKSTYSDPITLDYLLKVFTDGFLAK
ncbi:hypothetical protein D3C81_359580 [compost metagenome]